MRRKFFLKIELSSHVKITTAAVLLMILNLQFFDVSAQYPAGKTSSIIKRTNPHSYSVRIKLKVTNSGSDLKKMILVLPLAQTNLYQDVRDVNTHGADILQIVKSDDRYVRFVAEVNQVPKNFETREWFYDFSVTLYDVDTDFMKIGKIHEYDRNTELYKFNTGKSDKWIDPENELIKSTGDRLWNKSENYLDYARKCYDYIRKDMKYILRYEFNTLSDIMKEGGGSCGEMSSVYISLLRYKGIPSRHLIGMRPDNTPHAYSEFYLEKYGWIPVDTTADLQHGGFGFTRGGINIIILTKGADLNIKFDEEFTYPVSILQTFAHINWIYGGKKNLEINYEVTSKKIN